MRLKGIVKWFNDAKGFGFITGDEDKVDYFVHFSAINSSGFRSLAEGDVVEFDVWQTSKGPQASDIVRIAAAEPSPKITVSRLSGQSFLLEPAQRNLLLDAIGRLRSGAVTDRDEIKSSLMEVFRALLNADGYRIERPPENLDIKLDFVAVKEASADHGRYTLGGEFKLYDPGQAVDIEEDRLPGHVLFNAIMAPINRSLLFVNTSFTPAERASADSLSGDVDLIDFDALTAWVKRSESSDALAAEVYLIVREVSSTFARLIATDPRILDHLEWRDLERTVAEVFRGLGFLVELTPPAKDGGKDLVLECLAYGSRATYIVEVKHWRSGSRVGFGALRDFLSVVVRERRDGGLFLSTYGYCDNAFAQLTEIDRRKIRFGQQEKIVALCSTYVKAQAGIWSPPTNLTEVLYDGTLDVVYRPTAEG